MRQKLLRFGSIITIVLLFSNTLNVPLVADSPAVSADRFSGEQIFEALLLGTGPAAAKLPELQRIGEGFMKLPLEKREAAMAAIQRLKSDIQARDSAFFDSFGERMQSGDPFEVQSAFQDLNIHLQEVIPETLPSPTSPQTADAFLAVSVAWLVAILVVVAVAGEIAVYHDTAVIQESVTDSPYTYNSVYVLTYQQWVDDVPQAPATVPPPASSVPQVGGYCPLITEHCGAPLLTETNDPEEFVAKFADAFAA